MAQTGAGLPFAEDSHESYQAAVHAEAGRGEKTRAYLRVLYLRGGLTDHEASSALGCPLSSINSIRNGCMTLRLVAKSEQTRDSSYGQPCRVWVLTRAGKAVLQAWHEMETSR